MNKHYIIDGMSIRSKGVIAPSWFAFLKRKWQPIKIAIVIMPQAR